MYSVSVTNESKKLLHSLTLTDWHLRRQDRLSIRLVVVLVNFETQEVTHGHAIGFSFVCGHSPRWD